MSEHVKTTSSRRASAWLALIAAVLMGAWGCSERPTTGASATTESPCPAGATYERVEHGDGEWLGACLRSDGVLHGPQRHVADGQPRWERIYSEGALTRERRWHPGGALAEERAMISVSEDHDVFVPNGQARRWYPSGQLEFEGFYARGERVGVWSFFYASGQRAAEIIFDAPRDGCEQRLTTRAWSESGAVVTLSALDPWQRTTWRLDVSCEGSLADRRGL